jgi:nitrate reductase gamma subunit
MSIAGFVDGPLWYFSLTVFVVGVAWHLLRLVFRGVKPDYSVPRDSAASGGLSAVFSRALPRQEMRAKEGFQFFWGYIFHIGLFVLLIFGRPHVEFYEDRLLGFGWATLPDWAFLIVSELAFAGIMVLLLYRAMEPVTRLISSRGDYFGSILIFVVMLTGCMAMDQSAEPLRVIHLFLAEVLLIYFPFGSLMHAFLFVPSRAFTGAFFRRRGVPA